MTGAGVPDHDWFSLFEDHGGRIWLAGFDVTGHLNRERIVSIPGVPGGRKYSMAEDTSGSLWIATLSDGLIELRHDTVVQQIPWATFGDNHQAIALAADSEQGGLWLGFYQSGLAYFKDGRVRASYTAADGLGHGAVSEVSFDRDGALWVATEGGLSHLKNGRVATLTKKNGLPCDEAVWAIEDNARSLWVYMACGLVRISGTELAAWASDRNRTINRQVFDTSDGVRNRGIGQSMSPSVGKSPDGKIWFMNADTVSVIDPQHIPFNKVPPPVHIEQITANGKAHDASRGLRLPPLIHDISIDYTALSFAAPEKVHFRFKLEGQDQDWREVVNVRQVQYSNLAPRNYRFRVIASNEGGVWNETGDTFEFSIDPAYYQTDWFKACLVVAFFVMLFGLYRYRLYQFAQEFNGRLEERVDERTRIARELHDTLLQSFHGLMLRFQGAHNLLPSRPAEARQVLETAIDDAAQAITEARDAVQDLRSSTVVSNDLARAVTALGEELAAHHTNADGSDDPVAFSVEVEGTSRDLQPILRDDIYRITGEALRNALRHARARRIEVELHYDERELRVRVRDDGIGIDRGVQNHEGLSGHFGMTGMRERAKRIGGKLEVWGELGAGTEVELRIPASIAYLDYAGRGFRLFRRRVGTPS
jgi:signal transduction histidine kinase